MRLQVGHTKEIGDALFQSAMQAAGAMYQGLSAEQKVANAKTIGILMAALLLKNGTRIPPNVANDPK